METSIDINRIVGIIAFMYGQKAEVVILNGECYLFLGTDRKSIPLHFNEIDCLVYNEIIELDSGCNEKEHETAVYVLTEDSQERIKAIIKNKKALLLKE